MVKAFVSGLALILARCCCSPVVVAALAATTGILGQPDLDGRTDGVALLQRDVRTRHRHQDRAFQPPARGGGLLGPRVTAVGGNASQAAAPPQLSWDSAEAKAREVVQHLTPLERNSLLRGIHFDIVGGKPTEGWYIGNVAAVPRLGVPALKMQDAANGFRPTEDAHFGTTTSWPCMLALASTWDAGLVERVAAAIGREFRGKGANVVLGPSINVHRVAQNGRNFEYLSGEDPYLGAQLTTAYVRGVQGQGVMAVAKHFAFNEQETNRFGESSDVDARTAWELYYPPFEAAVEAGVGGFMCAYNKVNGTHACQNPDLLTRDLRGTMGFRGVVMSDWMATHSSDDLNKGLDVEMPGIPDSGPVAMELFPGPFFTERALSGHSAQALQRAAVHGLTSAFRLGLDRQPGCEPPCFAQLASDQTSDAHRELARTAATGAVVLLKNDGVLPLDHAKVKRVAVLGSAATAGKDLPGRLYYSGSGSGHVPPGTVVSPFDGLQRRGSSMGVAVVLPPGESDEDVKRTVLSADVAIVVVATSSTEGVDRQSLALDGDSDALIARVAALRPTVVLMQTPGAVLMPWRNEVAAAANLFLGGQETGSAWSAVIFGDVSPSGKLPIMFPATEADTIKPDQRQEFSYVEGLFTSYRSPVFKAAFPFGHGLSYTTFDHGTPQVVRGGCEGRACVRLTITNSGARPGVEVAQAYLHFGSAPGTPRLLLRGFHRTQTLQPGEQEDVLYTFTARDLSVFDVSNGWLVQDDVEVHLGASSEDIRQTIVLD